MTLAAGTRLGPYELLTLIGEGGMGQVYRGRDTRLGRTVAIKVLSARVDVSPERRARFEREARAISALSHPHICAVFDVGIDGDVDYLVMEHLEGESLAARLARGPLPLEEVIQYGRQIADALALAHRTGVIHRDLKPGNILLTASGIRLLDFGLAKLHSETDQSVSPETMAGKETELVPPPLTVEGAVFGTPQYMAPEQLEGRSVDARADLWAFGCVLYEMTTGARPFAGASLASTMAAIISGVPEPPSARVEGLPAALDRLILHCLVKDPARRWQNAFDAKLELDAIAAGTPADSVAATSVPRRRLRPWLGALGVAAAALAGLWIGRQGGESVARPAVRFDVPPPPGTTFLADFVEVVSLAVSPDGTRLAFVGVDVGVDAPGAQAAEQRPGARVPGTRVWLRNVADLEAAALPGTDGATSILWSPDGRSLAFFAGGRLRRVDLEGGSPVTICDLSPGIGYAGTWGPSGTILFASVQGDAIYSVPAAGGTATRLLVPDPSRHEGRIAWPQFLPDGRGFLFWARSSSKAATLMLADGGAAPRPVAAVNSRAAFVAPDWIVFARDGALLAQHFDAAGARLTGAPIAIAPAVPVFVSSGWAGFAASPSGSLLYLTGLTSSRLTWLDRTGTPQGTVGTPGNYLNVALSPDARSLLADRSQPELGTYDIWKFDLDRNVTTRITSDPDADFAPVWLPGTNSFVYSTIRGGDTGNPNLMRRNLDDGREEPVQPRNAFEQATDASLDGRLLTFIERDASGRLRNWVLELSGGRPPTELFHADDQVTSARFSPDARYVVYISAESGQGEAYVAPLSGAREPVRISQDGAAVVRWRHDGREILFLNRGRMTSVPVTTQPQLNLGVPRTLFTLPGGVEWTDFDVTPDGQRILAVQIERHAGTAPATAVVGWAPGSTR